MSWQTKRIGDFCETGSGGTPARDNPRFFENGTIPWVKSGELRQRVVEQTEEFITQEALEYSSAKLVPAGAVLVAMYGATAGQCALLGIDAATNQAVCFLLPDRTECLPKYLYYSLATKTAQLLAQRVGGAQPNISQKVIRDTELVLPPLAEQMCIVQLVEAADDMRCDAKRTHDWIEQSSDAIFRHCFGENFPHESNLQREALHQVAEVVSGVTKGRTLSGSEVRMVAYMRVANVQDGHIALDDVKTIEATDQEIAHYALQPDDILLTEGGDPDKLGRGAIWNGSITPCIHQNHIFRVRITTDELLPEYLSALFSSAYGKSYFLRMAKQTTGIASMNIGQLKQFPVVMAPRDKQIEFKRLQAQFDEIKARLAKQAATLEILFQTLLQRAFDGRLTAKWREEMQLRSRGS